MIAHRTLEILQEMQQDCMELSVSAAKQGMEQEAYDLERDAQCYLGIMAEYRADHLLFMQGDTMSNFTVWFDPEAQGTLEWCIQGDTEYGFWVDPVDTLEVITEYLANPIKKELESMEEHQGVIDKGDFETLGEALAFIRMMELME
ncbi:hypothetical protein HYP06_gp058 [Vibrio phage vB_VspP_pVa5]|uniref:Uncharacterized protein n=1 Tax=Vibrio phage vB_VspP_pVa5 TaxID=1913109 RepID=A0A1J0GV55_9CAUD|nr:hypothetical protein HYP06_gp058 [Vibrio phage vB_VspP_pVa5]APC46060.1 hypothetical protein vBVspPpVa5_0058 [Vibrio phage vB_VspP_pVa5]